MSEGYTVAVVGATGLVGEALLTMLKERQFPITKLHALAGERSAGTEVNFGRQEVVVQRVDDFDFKGVDIAFFSAGSAVSAAHAPRAAAAGAAVIDNTSQFRNDDHIPLVVSEVNPHALADWRRHGIIANPNCSTMVMLVALKPLHQAVGIRRINVATYQSVSGAGRRALEELGRQTAAQLTFREPELDVLPARISFNLIPQIDRFEDNGYTREEMKMHWETRKILEDPEIAVNATAVRVPVFFGHSLAVHLETREPITAAAARALLEAAPGVVLKDLPEPGGYPTPAMDSAGQDPVFVGRIRQDHSHPLGLNLWVVGDNIRKGAALNAVQIAEVLVKSFW